MDGQGLPVAGYPAAHPPGGGAVFGNEIDLLAAVRTLWYGKWLILAAMLGAGALAYWSVSQQIPIYRAEAKVMFGSQSADVGAAGEAVIKTTRTNSSMQNQIEILRSTDLLRRVIDDLSLETRPGFAPTRNATPPWYRRILPGTDTPTPAMPTQRQQDALVARVLSGLALLKVPNSDVIAIRFTSPDPDLAADIVNAMAAQYIVDQLEGKLTTFRAATQWLTDQVANLQIQVETAESAVLDAQAQVAAEAGASLGAAEDQRDAIATALVAARRDLAEKQRRHDRLRSALAAGTDMGALPELQTSRMVTRLRTRAAELLAKDAALAGTFRADHPNRARIRAERDTILEDQAREAGRILEAMALDLAAAATQVTTLDADLRAAEARTLRMSSQSLEIRNLEREARASRILYENLLTRLRETDAQEDLQTADARILTVARPPLTPLSTARNRILAGALILGALIGAGLVMLREYLTTTLRTAAEAEDLLHLPVLATLPTLGPRRQRGEVVGTLTEHPDSALAESVRNLRTSILRAGDRVPPKVVMVTSATPGEGKTTTAMLTALTSQMMGKAAIVVDCDLRRPALSQIMQTDGSAPGLIAVLEGRATLDDAIHKVDESGLHVLLTSARDLSRDKNPADILASDQFGALITALAQRYALVVLDTPPTLAVTDARVIAELADAIVFALRWDKTPRGAAEEGLQELTSVDAPVIGLAMTMVHERRAARYSYDGRGYYKGRYRRYYHA